MDAEMILGIIEIGVTAILVPLAGWGIKALADWLKSKTDNAMIEKYIDFASNAVEMAVKETTQTYVDALKKEGKFDAEAQKKAFELTLDRAKDLLTETAVSTIELAYGDVDSWLRSKIENTVADNK